MGRNDAREVGGDGSGESSSGAESDGVECLRRLLACDRGKTDDGRE
ncbi:MULTISPECIES: hypothetical protein [Leucobacter]|nr:MULTISPECIES: hypothetical protein [Leucobacter]